MSGLFGSLFDFNGDGELSGGEKAFGFAAMMGALCTCSRSTRSRLKISVTQDECICDGVVSVMIWISYGHLNEEGRKSILISLKAETGIPPRNTVAFLPILQ